MTDAQFAEAREQYELGLAGIVELAAKYGVSRQALSKRFKSNGVVKSSRAGELSKAASKSVQAVAQAAAEASERFQDKRAEWIEETRISGVKALKQVRLIAQKTIVDQMKSSAPLGALDDDMKVIARYNKTLIENIEGSLRVLKSDEHIDEEDLPSLIVEDFTDEDILQHHKDTGALPEDTTVEEMLAEEMDEDIEIEGVS